MTWISSKDSSVVLAMTAESEDNVAKAGDEANADEDEVSEDEALHQKRLFSYLRKAACESKYNKGSPINYLGSLGLKWDASRDHFLTKLPLIFFLSSQ